MEHHCGGKKCLYFKQIHLNLSVMKLSTRPYVRALYASFILTYSRNLLEIQILTFAQVLTMESVKVMRVQYRGMARLVEMVVYNLFV